MSRREIHNHRAFLHILSEFISDLLCNTFVNINQLNDIHLRYRYWCMCVCVRVYQREREWEKESRFNYKHLRSDSLDSDNLQGLRDCFSFTATSFNQGQQLSSRISYPCPHATISNSPWFNNSKNTFFPLRLFLRLKNIYSLRSNRHMPICFHHIRKRTFENFRWRLHNFWTHTHAHTNT